MTSRFWTASQSGIRLPLSGGGAAPAGVTWDPASRTPSADWTLTLGNLTAERTANSSFHGYVRATAAKLSGTVVHNIDALNSAGATIVGFSTAAETGQLGAAGGESIGWFDTGGIIINGGQVASGKTFVQADLLQLEKISNILNFYKWVAGAWALQHSENMVGYGVAGLAYPTAMSSSGFAFGMKLSSNFTGF